MRRLPCAVEESSLTSVVAESNLCSDAFAENRGDGSSNAPTLGTTASEDCSYAGSASENTTVAFFTSPAASSLFSKHGFRIGS